MATISGNPGPMPDSGDTLVCSCAGLMKSDIAAFLAKTGWVKFEEMLKQLNCGDRCTACLLDLEFLFSTLPRNQAIGTSSPVIRKASIRRYRDRLYSWLDSRAPLWAVQMINHIPVLSGPGIEEFLWLSNRKMGADGDKGNVLAVVPHRYLLRIRDGNGNVRASDDIVVEPGDSRRIDLSAHLRLEKSRPELTIGSAEISRQALAPGVRGTTRPHFEITAARGHTTLHSQATSENPSGWISYVHNPAADRVMFSLVNAGGSTLSVSFEFWAADKRLFETRCAAVPHGTALHEPEWPTDASREAKGRVVSCRFRARGRGKAHIIIATRSLDRLSIDHL